MLRQLRHVSRVYYVHAVFYPSAKTPGEFESSEGAAEGGSGYKEEST